ncbi:MAG: hypothetical protein ABEH77_09090 [Halobacteriaceae archaeon]
MSPASALAWGAVGALAFLVLARGHRLVAGPLAGFPTLLAVAAGVGAVTAAGAYAAEPRLKRRG